MKKYMFSILIFTCTLFRTKAQENTTDSEDIYTLKREMQVIGEDTVWVVNPFLEQLTAISRRNQELLIKEKGDWTPSVSNSTEIYP